MLQPPMHADVAVVGASAAGLFTAELLAREGRTVRVLERDVRPGRTPRTLICTSRLREVVDDRADGAVRCSIKAFELYTDGRVATVPLSTPDLVVERAALLDELRARAEAAGVIVENGRRFAGLEAGSGALTVSTTDGSELRAPVVIGADGASSRVARAAGFGPQRSVPLLQATVRLPADADPEVSRVWFRPEDTPYFYWLIPDSPGTGVLGLIGVQGPSARSRLESFLASKKLEPLAWQGARIPVYDRWIEPRLRLGSGQVWLVGDAAGQVKVSTVGGLVTGLRGAAAAVRALVHGDRSGLQALRRELDGHLWARRVLNRFVQRDYERMLDVLTPAVVHTFGAVSRDESLQLVWRACVSQPRLVALALRTLARRASRS